MRNILGTDIRDHLFNNVHMCMKNASMLSGIAKIYTCNVMYCRERYELVEDELL